MNADLTEHSDCFICDAKVEALRLEMVSKGLLPSGPLSELDGLKLLVAYCDQESAGEELEDMDAVMASEALKYGI